MFKAFLAAVILATSFNVITAECPNACSAHGKCGAYDMCICYRNWMANDCSERICQFGLAHVDTPMGDLDSSSGALSGPNTVVVTNDAMYPYGTTEQFPAMKDSDGNVLDNTAHYYRECSNKGICDRSTGNCQCFEGYGGSACQRATCPVSNGGVCSGHGTCETIKTIAAWDHNNVYNLWDEYSTMGCVCDPGYDGPDCSQRQCKSGPDPLYYDDAANVRISNYTYQIFTRDSSATVTGNYSIIFYDTYGEDWETRPIDINGNCDDVTDALEALPNDVIPSGSVRCYNKGSSHADNEYKDIPGTFVIKTRFTIAFTQNFGRLKPIELNIFLDGTRPTLFTSETKSTLGWHIYPNGFIGEYDDLVPDLCEGVLVKINAGSGTGESILDYLTTENTQQDKALKRCLGDADGKADTFLTDTWTAGAYTSNTDVYGWDFGSVNNPHLVKLVEATQESMKIGGYVKLTGTEYSGDLRDPAQYDYPITTLCTKTGTFAQRVSFNTPASDGAGYCANRNPPGFYAVLYFSNALKQFKLFTRPSADYSSIQLFHIYTTQGYLQMVNPKSIAFSHPFATSADPHQVDVDVARAHGNTMFVSSYNTNGDYLGQLDCETAPTGTHGALDCLNKNDYVMFLDTITTDGPNPSFTANIPPTNDAVTARGANPIYPNIYQVKKIFRDDKLWSNDAYNPRDEKSRHQIVLDYGINTKYTYDRGTAAAVYPAAVYKFHPKNSYTYVSQCSNHGICDQTSGLCQCFPGYTSDNCGVQNALAK